ncbi:peptidase S16 [Aliidiomarina sedimenti]|uniref:Peptidase S16 n=1 Tax=Aliidiomarina sedimenti TaxID=1933879 RepID=A0ABY0C1D4_9GAMM|nr:LON peptidase substrate-binding domain-containing protein [Aliidiomarina sedimenti]RUO31677.1 peptidase S16 [Aliidiomarina sedimenti]
MTPFKPTSIALFPLTSHVLPGGRLQLRIFEQRYIRMIKEALSEQKGFGVCMLNPKGRSDNNSHILPIGTLVNIIDFESLPDGMLGITVAGEQLFEVGHIDTAKDGLRTANVTLREEWQATELSDEDILLRQRLQEVFEAYPELAELYPEKKLDDEPWICQRWLEILPLEPQKKQELLASHNTQPVKEFIRSLVE